MVCVCVCVVSGIYMVYSMYVPMCIYVYSTCVEIDSNKVENVDNFEIDRCTGFQYIQAENIHTHIGLIFH